jgi:hypothetical protein
VQCSLSLDSKINFALLIVTQVHLLPRNYLFQTDSMTHKMYPFSKNKASFRIADILHQQTADNQLLAHHLMMKNGGDGGSARSSETNKNSDHKSQANEIKNVNDLSSSKSPSPIPETSSPEHHALKGGGGGDLPMKPTPMYSNFPLPFPLGIHPAFHPAAAYLNYADAIHKGERC